MTEQLLTGCFFNPTKGKIKSDQIIQEVINYLLEKPEKIYEIVVGCDSSSGEEPFFPVVLVVLRKGEGGRFFIKKITYQKKKFFNWKQRILEEVFLSCQLALFLKENLEKNIIKLNLKDKLNYQFRYIHADIGHNGETRDMIKEVISLIKGNGFEAKIKPESFAASTVADRFS